LTACALPAAAPTAIELNNTHAPGDFQYSLLTANARVVAILSQFKPTFGPGFNSGHYAATNALYPGDVIAITVYETGGQTLFPPPAVVPGAAATTTASVGAVATGASNIPPQVIEADGTIFVPFVGRVKVAGLTPERAGMRIQADLQGKAVSPQVLVSLINNIGNAATVGGEVNAARSVPLSSRGERLLDVIAAAGGAKYPDYATDVEVVRRHRAGTVVLEAVVNNPAENILIRPDDQIYLTYNPRTYSVLGATNKVAQFSFQHERVTLAEAIANAGGPIDAVGDPSNIYLFRFEPWYIARELLSADRIAVLGPTPPDFVPILYQLDLRNPANYFVAQAFQMRDKDVVLVTDAPATQIQKLLNIVKGAADTVYYLRTTVTTPPQNN
jgi:polysaccharide export outer membrane protein